MKNNDILSQITEFCRKADMAESTFGRRAVNDGKLVQRLREGKRITIDTLDRIQAYMAASMTGGLPPPRGLQVPPEKRDPRGNFRFFENRQKYLLFVHTCSEKRVVADRVALSSLPPSIPARRHCACSTRVSVTARCWRGCCAQRTSAFRTCHSTSPVRNSVSKTCA
ncbi:hypothetical protein ACVWXO_006512 [Bradyrhizobium sp. LM2.7]